MFQQEWSKEVRSCKKNCIKESYMIKNIAGRLQEKSNSVVDQQSQKDSNTVCRLPENSRKSFVVLQYQKDSRTKKHFSLNDEMLYFDYESITYGCFH